MIINLSNQVIYTFFLNFNDNSTYNKNTRTDSNWYLGVESRRAEVCLYCAGVLAMFGIVIVLREILCYLGTFFTWGSSARKLIVSTAAQTEGMSKLYKFLLC